MAAIWRPSERQAHRLAAGRAGGPLAHVIPCAASELSGATGELRPQTGARRQPHGGANSICWPRNSPSMFQQRQGRPSAAAATNRLAATCCRPANLYEPALKDVARAANRL